jgi:hypothetical protein
MASTMRTLKPSPVGKLSRAGIKKAVFSVHVYPSERGDRWEVKEIGLSGVHKRFVSKETAMCFANDVAKKKQAEVLVHKRHARLKVAAPNNDAVYRLVFDKR